MSQISIDEIQQNLPGFLNRVKAGETLIIIKAGKPVAEIKPINPAPKKHLPYGLAAGEFVVPEDFDAPLPEDVIADFQGR